MFSHRTVLAGAGAAFVANGVGPLAAVAITAANYTDRDQWIPPVRVIRDVVLASVAVMRVLLAACLFVLASPAFAQMSCSLPQKPMIEVELMFGRNIGGAFGVTDALWARFLAREVTPRFPDGLTVFDTAGQWSDAKTKAVVRERSKIVRVIVPADAQANEKIEAVAAAYKKQFRQDSVGVLTRPACVSF